MRKIPVLLVVLAGLCLAMPLTALASSHGGAAKGKGGEVTPAMLTQGKAIYEKSCGVCHATGVAGAPKLGDKTVWKKHVAAGLDHMTEIAIKGEGAMPPRGGNPKLSDAEVRAAVAYMMENSR